MLNCVTSRVEEENGNSSSSSYRKLLNDANWRRRIGMQIRRHSVRNKGKLFIAGHDVLGQQTSFGASPPQLTHLCAAEFVGCRPTDSLTTDCLPFAFTEVIYWRKRVSFGEKLDWQTHKHTQQTLRNYPPSASATAIVH